MTIGATFKFGKANVIFLKKDFVKCDYFGKFHVMAFDKFGKFWSAYKFGCFIYKSTYFMYIK
jgi:hypothetical protein